MTAINPIVNQSSLSVSSPEHASLTWYLPQATKSMPLLQLVLSATMMLSIWCRKRQCALAESLRFQLAPPPECSRLGCALIPHIRACSLPTQIFKLLCRNHDCRVCLADSRSHTSASSNLLLVDLQCIAICHVELFSTNQVLDLSLSRTNKRERLTTSGLSVSCTR